jgi:hypothetical protein
MLQDTIPAHKGLTPSGKFITQSSAVEKFVCIFAIFLKLSNGCVLLMLGTHNVYKK